MLFPLMSAASAVDPNGYYAGTTVKELLDLCDQQVALAEQGQMVYSLCFFVIGMCGGWLLALWSVHRKNRMAARDDEIKRLEAKIAALEKKP